MIKFLKKPIIIGLRQCSFGIINDSGVCQKSALFNIYAHCAAP